MQGSVFRVTKIAKGEGRGKQKNEVFQCWAMPGRILSYEKIAIIWKDTSVRLSFLPSSVNLPLT